MVRVYHSELRCCPPLFSNYKWFNFKAAVVYLVIQDKVDELLARGGIELPPNDVGVYCNVFVVSKHMGGLCPIL